MAQSAASVHGMMGSPHPTITAAMIIKTMLNNAALLFLPSLLWLICEMKKCLIFENCQKVASLSRKFFQIY
jgi:hypothetical protein